MDKLTISRFARLEDPSEGISPGQACRERSYVYEERARDRNEIFKQGSINLA